MIYCYTCIQIGVRLQLDTLMASDTLLSRHTSSINKLGISRCINAPL